MFKDIFKKKKKTTTEEDEGNFTYDEDLKTNEFNDATIEYGEGEIEEDTEEDEFKEEEEIDKNKILFWALIAFLILLILIMLIIRGCVLTAGKLTSINVNTPKIIYVGERTKITAEATGSRNLRMTEYSFTSSNDSIVEIKAKGFLQGKSVTNELIPITTGEFILYVGAELETVKLDEVEKEITICRRLSEESFATDLIAVVGVKTKLVVDLGDDGECYDDFNYKIRNTDLVKIDTAGNLIGIAEGKTTITFTSGEKEIVKEIKIVTNAAKVTGIKLNKTTTSLEVGAREQIEASITPSDATNQNIKWTSSNEGVAKVSQTGVITGVGVGTAVITATTEDGGYKAIITVTVTKKSSGGTTGGGTGTNTNKDKTAPKLTSVTMYSDNSDKTLAKLGNKIMIKITSDEDLKTIPSIYIANQTATVKCSTSKVCIGTAIVKATAVDGVTKFEITSYKDAAGNTGAAITATTDKTSVLIDKELPYCLTKLISETESSAIVTFTYFDYLSGLKSVLDPNGSYLTNLDQNNKQNYTFTKTDSNKSYTMTVTDNAGNIKSCSYTVSKLETKTFIVTLVKRSGAATIGNNSISCTTTGTNCTVTLPTITATSGYKVKGWIKNESSTTADYASGATITITSDMTLYTLVQKTAVTNYSAGGYSSTSGSSSKDNDTFDYNSWDVSWSSETGNYSIKHDDGTIVTGQDYAETVKYITNKYRYHCADNEEWNEIQKQCEKKSTQ